MFASSNYPPDHDAARRFVAEMRHGTLIASAPPGHPQVSILPFVRVDELIELHCVQADPTFDAVRANPQVSFLVSDYLGWSPHDWVDGEDAGRATLHFRAVSFECQAERISTDPDDVAAALTRLLQRYEPAATYRPIRMGDFYGPRLRRLATMQLRILREHVKFKVGPAGRPGLRAGVAARLRESGDLGDARAAAIIDASVAAGTPETPA